MVSYPEFRDPRDTRLAVEHEKLDELCQSSDVISYQVLKQPNKRKPPEAYRLIYSIRTIITINSDNSPVYNNPENGDVVKVLVEFPPEFPDLSKGAVLCTVEGAIFHPNINTYKSPKGRICINQPALGSWMTIDDLAIHVGEILQWKNYLADVDKPPYPMDNKVAKWVKEYAEPKGIVKPDGEKPVDVKFLKSRNKKEDEPTPSPTIVDDLDMDFKVKDSPSTDNNDLDMDFEVKDSSSNDNDNLDMEFLLK